ncbi:hypothetical protein BC936DRAFT_138852 [Jimgerdemannia flammicorona]|uniref:Uncharacterized protein n=1 Tax=Jimgerdemannia flammicorona TaxID=994334 RepID=A0A433BG26_9FUNG|nr:hypothetical protein BC936DRAFT_138852 [Jimgerdemannia flammicorona]
MESSPSTQPHVFLATAPSTHSPYDVFSNLGMPDRWCCIFEDTEFMALVVCRPSPDEIREDVVHKRGLLVLLVDPLQRHK